MRRKRRRGDGKRITPTSGDPSPIEFSAHLLDPVVRQAVKIAASVKHPQSTTLKINWTPDTVQRIADWLRGGAEPAVLATLLAHDSLLIGHPLVYRQLVHLRWLRTVLDEADIEQGFSTPRDYIPPAGVRLAADVALRALSEAWVRAMLGKGWSLNPPAKQRGRKRTLDSIVDAFDLLGQYENVLDRLNKHYVRRTKGESDQAWAQRLAEIVRVVWDECFSRMDAAPQGSESDDLLNIPLVYSVDPPLPDEHAEWAKQAVDEADEGAIRDKLAYRMIGYRPNRPNLSSDTVRGRIQAARKLLTKS